MTLAPRRSLLLGVCLTASVVAFLHPDAQRAPAQPPDDAPLPAANIVRQGFPAANFDPEHITRSETAWEIEWDLTHPRNQPYTPPGCTLRIRSAKFMFKDRLGQPKWVTVARMIELAEIYVPYDNGHTAFLDIHDMSFYMTRARPSYLGPPCVAPGEILKSSNPAWSNVVLKEVHDDGIRWMSAETDGRNQVSDRARRGEKLTLWGTYYGANYRYLIDFGFTDDGMVNCRIGPTGRNIFNRQTDLKDTHMHIGCWRFEPDLGDPTTGQGGPKDNEILHVRHVLDENTERFGFIAKPFAKNYQGEACEGSARWIADEFTTLRMQSKSRKNAHGRNIAYDLIPQRVGALTKLQPEGGGPDDANMDWVNYDFWVTRAEPSHTSYTDVPRYASQKRSLKGQPTTIWTCAPVLHAARGEDFGPENGTNSYTGVALTFYTGFYLKPRDLFDSTPLYQATQSRSRSGR